MHQTWGEHGEEEESSVVEHFAGIVADVQVQQTNQNSNTQVRHHPQVGQHLDTQLQILIYVLYDSHHNTNMNNMNNFVML